MIVYCATTNAGKLREFRAAGEGIIAIEPLPNLTRIQPCEETGATFEENAIQKALHYGVHTDGYLFVDDSGLAVDSLNGAPGVRSARYAGEEASDEDNNRLLLSKLKGVDNRAARFVCVIALAYAGELVRIFYGEVEGIIAKAPCGLNGFGYDPLFYYAPFGRTFGETNAGRKREVSHRGKALAAMADYLHSVS